MNALTVFALGVLAAGLLTPAAPWDQRVPNRTMRRSRPLTRGSEVEGIEDVSLLLELLGASLEAGASVPHALRFVAVTAHPSIRDGLAVVVAGLDIGATWNHAWERATGNDTLAILYRCLGFGAATGAPTASLLYAEAEQLRRSAQRESERRAAALGVRLVIPLGLCALPAFICLGVVPVVVAMLPTL